MARITVEDCLTKETNRFALVLLAAKRTKQLLHGGKALVAEVKNKAVVTALREIASGKVRFMTEEEMRLAEEDRLQAQEEARVAAAAESAKAAQLTAAATLVATPTLPTFEPPPATATEAEADAEEKSDDEPAESANR